MHPYLLQWARYDSQGSNVSSDRKLRRCSDCSDVVQTENFDVFCFVLFLVDEGRKDPNTTKLSGPSSVARSGKRCYLLGTLVIILGELGSKPKNKK